MKWLYRLFNHDKIDEQRRTIDIYKERNEQLEAELREYKGYKLKYEVTKLYVEDDEALLELFDAAKKAQEQDEDRQLQLSYLAREAAMRQQIAIGGIGGCGQQSGLGIAQIGMFR